MTTPSSHARNARPRALIVGAGAVGQVYGLHLHRAGVEVSYLVRERYVDLHTEGFDLFEIGLFRPTRKGRHHRFTARHFLHAPEQVASLGPWDQVWLTIPSNALTDAWLERFRGAFGDASIISLQPGPTDREKILAHIPVTQLIQGMIGIIAYQGPLDGESLPTGYTSGLVFWHPPGSPSLFTGENASALRDLLTTLEKGGCPAAHAPNLAHTSAYPTTTLMPFLIGLEAREWSLTTLRHDIQLLDLIASASKEARDIMEQKSGTPPPVMLPLLYRPATLKMALGLLPSISPFPLQTYLRYHFMKVHAQTLETMHTYLELGEAQSLPTTHLQALLESISPG